MIHNAWSYASGDANALRKQADDLEKITRPSIEIYKEVSNLDEDTIQKMMDEETWITQDEALEWGFATDIQKNAVNQSINAQYHLGHEIMRNKELARENRKLKEALSKFEDKKSNGWDAFFDTKN